MGDFEMTVVMDELVVEVVPIEAAAINLGVVGDFELTLMGVVIQVVPPVINVRVMDHFELTVMDEAVTRVVPI